MPALSAAPVRLHFPTLPEYLHTTRLTAPQPHLKLLPTSMFIFFMMIVWPQFQRAAATSQVNPGQHDADVIKDSDDQPQTDTAAYEASKDALGKLYDIIVGNELESEPEDIEITYPGMVSSR